MLEGVDKKQLAVTGISLLIEGFMAAQDARSERLGITRARPPRRALDELLHQAGARVPNVEGAVNGLLGHRVDAPNGTSTPAPTGSVEARLQALSARLYDEIAALQRRLADLETRKTALEVQVAQMQAGPQAAAPQTAAPQAAAVGPAAPDALVVFEAEHLAILIQGAVAVGELESNMASLEAKVASC